MPLISVCLTFTSECSHCRNPLPVNRAAEHTLCTRCWNSVRTPAELWQVIVSKQIYEASAMEPETQSEASGIHGAVGSYFMSYGRAEPRCGKCGARWPAESLVAIAEGDSSNFRCPGCSNIARVRKPPEWFARIVPFAIVLAGETAPDDQGGTFSGGTAGISIHCYHCGGPLPLDGSSRTVTCRHCGQELLVPDDIWQRLHPVAEAHPWYILLDTGEATTLLPADIDDFMDLEALPGGDTAVLFEEDSESCLGRADRIGGFRWIVRNLPFGDYARLLYTPSNDLLWILDRDEDVAQAYRASDGGMAVTIKKTKHSPDQISAIDHEGIAACSDGTVLVYRCWEDDNYSLRRFDDQGRRIPLWSGVDDASLKRKITDWDSLKDRPARLPEGAWIAGGPGETLYVIDRSSGRSVVVDRQGGIREIISPRCDGLELIQDCGVSGDGEIFVLFDHEKKIGGLNFSHVGRIDAGGAFRVLAGPLVKKKGFSLGTDLERMSVSEKGELHIINRDFNNFRVLSPDGSPVWRSPGTVIGDDDLAEELAEARGNA